VNLGDDFEELFKIQQYDIKLELTDLYNDTLLWDSLPLHERQAQSKRKKKGYDTAADEGPLSEELANGKIPLDQIFLNIIVSPLTNIQVKRNALEVLIKNLNQRDILIKELSRTEIIVDKSEYVLHLKFFNDMRQLM
jgi:hypothetical protein